ncbi:hypothetical protein Cni_G12908 [Canna indica]|uniref:Uncharacterized protein n=1 Tax=Canna indica TaxID=4628 RepID=A0AAQ3KD19_9LILI|nr:hypothetical protein Cni_G12908 [Canna indica]
MASALLQLVFLGVNLLSAVICRGAAAALAAFIGLLKLPREAGDEAIELARSFLGGLSQYAWELVKDAATSIVAGLFEALVAAVGALVQLAMSAVAGMVEMSRNAVEGLSEVLAQVVAGAVQVAVVIVECVWSSSISALGYIMEKA